MSGYRRRDERDSSVEHIGRGESYRPGGHRDRDRSPRRDDSYRARSPPRIPTADTYVPGGGARRRSRSPGAYRRRSRSPPRGAASWRDRERSPPRRGFSPPRGDTYRRDERDRSPRRDTRYDDRERFARSPPRRPRSPIGLKRSRDASPAGSRGFRSPKRERLASPRGRYDARAPERSPPRRAYSPPRDRGYRAASRSPRRPDPYAVDNWRRRSPSPVRDARDDYRASGRESVATSRRSSPPPVHPSRAGFMPEPVPAPKSPGYGSRRRSPSPTRPPPTGPAASFRNGDPPSAPRGPPTGPSGGRSFTSNIAPPSAPRGVGNPILSAPSRPRGGFGGGSGFAGPSPHHATRDYQPSGGPPSGPGGLRRTSLQTQMQYSNPSYRAPQLASPSGPPSGPRASVPNGSSGSGGGGGPPTGPRNSVPTAPSFQSSNRSSSGTYPQTQRFNGPSTHSVTQQYLSDLPEIVPGGRKMPDPYNSEKLKRLEEELERARGLLQQKEERVRGEVRGWERAERESEKVGLRSRLAEEGLRGLSGEEVGGAAF